MMLNKRMRTTLLRFGFLLLTSMTFVCADALKNSLNKLQSEDTSVMVDLNSRPAKPVYQSRSPKSVVATVNGEKILKKDADKYLSRVTQGKVKDFDRLPQKQRKVLIHDLARPIVLDRIIQKELSEEEKNMVYQQFWIEKKRATTEVSNDEMMALYNNIKAETLAKDPKASIPPFITLGNQLKMKIIENKMMMDILKDVKIEVVTK